MSYHIWSHSYNDKLLRTPSETCLSPRAAFRGRHMAAKSLASKSASALAEILGISPTPSASASGYPSSAPTPYPSTPYEPGPSTSNSGGSATPAEGIKLQELTVSNKSVMDYFKEKLAAKSNARVFAPSSAPPPNMPAADDDDYDERPRIGLGASKLRTEVARATESETVEVEERRGLGGIGSGMRSSFAAMFTSATVTSTVMEPETAHATEPDDDAAAAHDADADEEMQPSKKSKKKDKERKKEKTSKKKGKGKEKAADEVNVTNAEAAEDGLDEKAERKRRKEEKRRRKEAEALATTQAAGVEDRGAMSDTEVKEKKRKKDKRKDKVEG